MTSIKIIAYLGSAILIFFGILFIWGAFSPQGSGGWILIGVLTIGIGFGIIWLVSRSKAGQVSSTENITLKIDLPANVNLDSLKCKSCGGSLTMDNIQMVSGAPVVNCPYCHTTYQLTEDPKW
jgi:hypothetical protein